MVYLIKLISQPLLVFTKRFKGLTASVHKPDAQAYAVDDYLRLFISPMNIEKIKDYYKQTAYEYRVVWNWKRNDVPALHFGYYDEQATTHHQSLFRANEVLAKWAGIKQGSSIVDAGCGMGQSAAWLATNYDARVIGITIAPNQAAEAAKNIAAAGITGVDFYVGNYLQMPLSDNSVDIVWAIESVCYATDKSAFYKEAFRVLKPGGKLVMADSIRCARPLSKKQEQLLKDVFGGWMIEDIDTVEEHAGHSITAGFENFRFRDVTNNMMISYRNLKQQTSRYILLGWLMHKTGFLSKMRYDNLRYSNKQMLCIQENVFRYGHLTATKPD